MAVMNILTADDLSYVELEIKNVSVKRYKYKENIVTELYNHFKYDAPRKIIFGSENQITKEFMRLIYNDGYELAEDGTVLKMSDNEICYNSIEHAIELERDTFMLTVNGGHDQYKLTEILLGNGYIISSKVDKSKVHISIHGMQE